MTRKIAMVTVRTVLDMLANGSSYSQIRRRTGASNGFTHKLASAAMPDVSAFLKRSDVEIHGLVVDLDQRKFSNIPGKVSSI